MSFCPDGWYVRSEPDFCAREGEKIMSYQRTIPVYTTETQSTTIWNQTAEIKGSKRLTDSCSAALWPSYVFLVAKMTSKVMSWVSTFYFWRVCLDAQRKISLFVEGKRFSLESCGVRVDYTKTSLLKHCLPQHARCQLSALCLPSCLCDRMNTKKKPIFSLGFPD